MSSVMAALSCCSASTCSAPDISQPATIRVNHYTRLSPSCKFGNSTRLSHAFSPWSSSSFRPPAFAAAEPPAAFPEASAKAAVETAGSVTQAVAANAEDDLIINVLGTAAFIGVIVLTLAVVYLTVSEFLEKRARDEETKKLIEESKSSKKKLSRVGRGGPKGFGKRFEDSD